MKTEGDTRNYRERLTCAFRFEKLGVFGLAFKAPVLKALPLK